MKLQELLKIVDDDVTIHIDGKEYYAELLDDMSELEVKEY